MFGAMDLPSLLPRVLWESGPLMTHSGTRSKEDGQTGCSCGFWVLIRDHYLITEALTLHWSTISLLNCGEKMACGKKIELVNSKCK